MVVQDCASFSTRSWKEIVRSVNMNYFRWRYNALTNLRPLKTLNPSTNSKIISNKLAVTIIKSKIFHPHRKKSLDNAINLIIHSNVKMDVKTWKILIRNLIKNVFFNLLCFLYLMLVENSHSYHDVPWLEMLYLILCILLLLIRIMDP